MLHRIAIKGFKSLLNVELELPRLAVLAGPNAAGKSNVLDALQMLARAGTQRTLADALTPPIRGFPNEAFALPPGGLAELLQAPSASFLIEADFVLTRASDRGAADRLRYRLRVAIEPASGALSVGDEYLTRMTKDWRPKDLPRVEPSNGELLVRQVGRGGRPSHEELGANHIVEALEATGEIVTQGGADFADEIVGAMDLYRAGRAVPSLGMFIDDLRAALRRLP